MEGGIVEIGAVKVKVEDYSRMIRFIRQYKQRIPLQVLEYPTLDILREGPLQELIYKVLSASLDYDPPTAYDISVWKQIIRLVELATQEDADPDIRDCLFTGYTELVTKRAASNIDDAQTAVVVEYDVPCDILDPLSVLKTSTVVKLLERPRILSADAGTGQKTWEASIALAKTLLERIMDGVLAGKKILELGAGTGLVSLVCAKEIEFIRITTSTMAKGTILPMRVVATDGDIHVRDRFLQNIDRNFHSPPENLKFQLYSWGDALEQVQYCIDSDPFDLVVAADVTFDPISLPFLVTTFVNILDLNPLAEILVTATLRNTKTMDQFFSLCQEAKLSAGSSIVFEKDSMPISKQNFLFLYSSADIALIHIRR